MDFRAIEKLIFVHAKFFSASIYTDNQPVKEP